MHPEYDALVAIIAIARPVNRYQILAALDTEQLDMVIAAHREEIDQKAADLFLQDVLDRIEEDEQDRLSDIEDYRAGYEVVES